MFLSVNHVYRFVIHVHLHARSQCVKKDVLAGCWYESLIFCGFISVFIPFNTRDLWRYIFAAFNVKQIFKRIITNIFLYCLYRKKHIDECFYAEISWNLIYWFVWESMGFDGSPYSKKSTSENKCTHFFLFWEVFGNNESKINDLRNQRNNAFI